MLLDEQWTIWPQFGDSLWLVVLLLREDLVSVKQSIAVKWAWLIFDSHECQLYILELEAGSVLVDEMYFRTQSNSPKAKYLAIWQFGYVHWTMNMAKWGVPEKSFKNAAHRRWTYMTTACYAPQEDISHPLQLELSRYISPSSNIQSPSVYASPPCRLTPLTRGNTGWPENKKNDDCTWAVWFFSASISTSRVCNVSGG